MIVHFAQWLISSINRNEERTPGRTDGWSRTCSFGLTPPSELFALSAEGYVSLPDLISKYIKDRVTVVFFHKLDLVAEVFV